MNHSQLSFFSSSVGTISSMLESRQDSDDSDSDDSDSDEESSPGILVFFCLCAVQQMWAKHLVAWVSHQNFQDRGWHQISPITQLGELFIVQELVSRGGLQEFGLVEMVPSQGVPNGGPVRCFSSKPNARKVSQPIHDLDGNRCQLMVQKRPLIRFSPKLLERTFIH